MKYIVLAIFLACSCCAETRFYIAPIVDLTNGARLMKASKVLQWKAYFDDTTFVSCVMPNPTRNFCWTKVTATNKEVFDVLAEDVEIILLPFVDSGGNYLTEESAVEKMTSANKTKSFSILESSGIPTDRFLGTTKISDVRSVVEKSLMAVQVFKDSYPKGSLDTALSLSERNDLTAMAGTKGVNIVLNAGATVRTFVWEVVDKYKWNGK